MTLSNVQEGTITISAGNTSGTDTITAVDTTKAFVVLQGWTYPGNAAADQVRDIGLRIILTNSTTVTATVGSAQGADFTVGYTVIEFN